MKPAKAKKSNTNTTNRIDDLVPNNPRFDAKYQSSDDKIDTDTRNHMLYDTWQKPFQH